MNNSLITAPLIMFAVSMCVTPGPNNIMLAGSGVNFGFRRTIPHILGIELGMVALFVISACGLGVLFDVYPKAQVVLKILSSLYLLYFAYKIINAKRVNEKKINSAKPLNLGQAALFQFINPKALIITTSAIAAFAETGENYLSSCLAVILVFSIICIPAISLWAGLGSIISCLLKSNTAFRSFNACLGALTALSVIMIIK